MAGHVSPKGGCCLHTNKAQCLYRNWKYIIIIITTTTETELLTTIKTHKIITKDSLHLSIVLIWEIIQWILRSVEYEFCILYTISSISKLSDFSIINLAEIHIQSCSMCILISLTRIQKIRKIKTKKYLIIVRY